MTFQASAAVDRLESNLIVTDSRPMAIALQQALARLVQNGPDDKVVSLDDAFEALQSNRDVMRRVLIAVGSDHQRGLNTIRRIGEICTVPLFVLGPRDAQLILDAVNAGADNFIEDSESIEENLAKALSRNKPNGKLSIAVGQLICVASARGGCGSSSIAVNLALALTEKLKRTALCDFDLQNGVCDALLNLKPKHTILDLGRCLEKLDHNAVEMALVKHSSGVHLLPAPTRTFDRSIPIGDLFQRVLRTVRQMFPVVVTDLSQLPSDVDAEQFLSTCDQFVLVTQMDFNSIRSAGRILNQLERTGLPTKRIQIVGNRCGQPNGLSGSISEQALNRKISHFLPDDPKCVNLSINCGTPYYLASPTGRLAKAVGSLAESLLESREQKSSSSVKGGTETPPPHSNKRQRVKPPWGKWLQGPWTE